MDRKRPLDTQEGEGLNRCNQAKSLRIDKVKVLELGTTSASRKGMIEPVAALYITAHTVI